MNFLDTAHEVYRSLLDREPDPDGEASFVSSMKAGVTLGTLIGNMIRSPEFLRRIQANHLTFDAFKPICTLLDGRLRLWIDLHDAHVSLGCLMDNYEPRETAFVLDRLSPGDTFVDIGANVGWFTIRGAERVGAKGRVHSFEPRTQTHGLLARSIKDNGFEKRCSLHKVALAAEVAPSRLVWMPETENPGGSRLVRDDAEVVDDMAGEDIQMVTLDSIDIQGKVPVMKLDVEGAEAMVLRGAKQFFQTHRPVILTEVFGQALRHVSKVDLDEFVAIVGDLDYSVCMLDADGPGSEVTDLAALETPGPISCVLMPR